MKPLFATLSLLVTAQLAACDDSPFADPNEPVDLADVLLEEGEIGHLPWPSGGETVNTPYEVRDGLVTTGGDMVLGTVDEVRSRLFTSFSANPSSNIAGWPNNIVPYVVEPSMSQTLKNRIAAAVAQWNASSLFFLRPRQAGEHAIHFVTQSPQADPMCRAEVGYQSWKSENTIWLADGDDRRCSTVSVVHEIGHALGLKHEHQRSDRDLYISVIESAIRPNRLSDFAMGAYGFGPYDFRSLMHYGNTSSGKIARNGSRMTTIMVNGCSNTTSVGCVVGRQTDSSGRVIITDLDRAGAVRANHGSSPASFRLRNENTMRCLKASSQGYVLAGNDVSTSSSCSDTNSRRWYQTSRPGAGDKVLVNKSGRVCLSSDDGISAQNCDADSAISFTMMPLGSSRYQLKQGNRCLRELNGSLFLSSSCGTTASYRWKKI